MTTTLQSMLKVALLMALMVLVFDIGKSIYIKQNYQGGIDFCAKAASMEIVRDQDYANGIVKIDEDKSKNTYREMMQKQFHISHEKVEKNTIYAEPINEVPYTFEHPISGKEYTINEPMFVVVYRVGKKGVFMRKNIFIDNLSGSRISLRKDK
ncbi:hypothetical protein [Clostridiisalibacter paucivorans]|uniref:hypothetical protein n=1 Tax=Clostridiisalibacter paucivorans TaxID=408753 RepID=UPI0004796C67|nr:hypothetical protein [Clostridiisalibacter paucivorans]